MLLEMGDVDLLGQMPIAIDQLDEVYFGGWKLLEKRNLSSFAIGQPKGKEQKFSTSLKDPFVNESHHFFCNFRNFELSKVIIKLFLML